MALHVCKGNLSDPSSTFSMRIFYRLDLVFALTMNAFLSIKIAIDTIMFGTSLYYMIGLAGRDDFVNFLVYLSLYFVFAILMSQQLCVFAAFAGSGTMTAMSSCIILLLILFGGFIVAPDTIPNYYVWLYWWNPFAWIYRALLVNEFRSGRWQDPDQILSLAGFVTGDGQPFGQEWVGYAFAYALPYSAFCTVLRYVDDLIRRAPPFLVVPFTYLLLYLCRAVLFCSAAYETMVELLSTILSRRRVKMRLIHRTKMMSQRK